MFLGSNRGESSRFMQTRLISASRTVKSQARPSAQAPARITESYNNVAYICLTVVKFTGREEG